ncbi:meiotically up-regulated gene 113-domain-containing protein [Delphinella strobiligena]|nr:meiotically up-regulated gene 113-domain-containing protein [Delphinella strobiligena]
MSFNNRTPESLVLRSDSKNPATTCRGITSNGRTCRRALAPQKPALGVASRHGLIDATALYCWQHRDQVQSANIDDAVYGGRKNVRQAPIQERTSIDSLVGRLGIMSVRKTPERKQSSQAAQARYHQNRHSVKESPSNRPSLQSPSAEHKYSTEKPEVRRRKQTGFWASLCCTTNTDEDEYLEVNFNMRSTSTPDTRHLLSFIPGHLSPQTTSALLSELSKPISPHDEDGYIYIFWLTDTSTIPSEDTAASLLSPPNARHQRRPSDVMSEYSYTPDSSTQSKPTIKLKIGRANNVHRRMNEWTRQCGYNLSLVRWYPYVSSAHPSPTASPARMRKVRHAHRVERLIHIELASIRVKKDCGRCGREHKEWFEIEATEKGVKGVDEVIRRWVGWADSAEGST